jgi:hypothetical protein
MTSELGHLLPELRHEATLCNEERIRRIQLDRWISCRAVLKGRTGRALFSRVSGQLVQKTLY